MARRYGHTLQLALITVLSRNHQELPTDINAKVMEQMSTAISTSLRSGDVYTRPASSQFLILLPKATQTTGAIAIQRVLQAFYALDSSNQLLDTSVELLPMLSANLPVPPTT